MKNKIYCKIQNEGEIDVNALFLIGASTKEGDETKIGFFGSGVKYALASALRENIGLKVFSGEKEIKISTKKQSMRGQSFDCITINNKMTGMTTRMGKDWKPWFIFREFYCNALDEGGVALSTENKVVGEAGKTNIYIELNEKVKGVFDNFDLYFSKNREPIHTFLKNKVFRKAGEKMCIYRKGIQIYFEHNSIFDYDFDSIAINESRVARSDFEVEWQVVAFWKHHASEQMIRELVLHANSYEQNIDWSYVDIPMDCAWERALKDKIIIPKEHSGYFADDQSEFHITLPHKLCVSLHQSFGDKLTIRGMVDGNRNMVVFPANEKEKEFIEDSLVFLEKAGLSDIRRFPIEVADIGEKILGTFEDGKIYLSRRLFDRGRRAVVECIIEEHIHGRDKVSDRTREMQDTLISLYVASLEKQVGQYL